MSAFFTRCKVEMQNSEIGNKKEEGGEPKPMFIDQDFYSFGGLNFIKAPYFLKMTSPSG